MEPINQSQDNQWNPWTMMTHDFLPRFTCLLASYVLVVMIHPLGGSRTNRHHTPNPQLGAAQPIQDEDHTSHEQFTRIPFGSPPGKGQEPLTITMIGARDNHQPLLDDPHCSKPSRWRQPPRVTNESHNETRTPSASRWNHSSNALGFSPNLTKMLNQWWRWVGGLWLSS